MSSFFELVQKRQSVRRYKNKSVDRLIIERCINAARLAPSACNSQPWYFIVIDNPKLKSKIAQMTKTPLMGINSFVNEAPILVVLVTEKSKFTARLGSIIKDKSYNLIDIGIAAEHFCLQATDEGLGTCILGWFDESKIKKLLKIPYSKRVYLMISVGYSATNYKLRKKVRKPIEKIRAYNQYK